MGLYTDFAKKNIRYDKLLYDARYKKLVESTQEESDSSKEKICYTNITIVTLVDLQESGDIGDQKDTLMSGI